jgi:hypothetical protein
MAPMTGDRFRKGILILLVVAISAAFVTMIRMFLLTILLQPFSRASHARCISGSSAGWEATGRSRPWRRLCCCSCS